MGDNLQMWSMLVGFFLPNVVALVQQPRWTDTMRALVTAVACIAAGTGTVAFGSHGLHMDGHLATSILTVGVTALATYRNFWKPVGIVPAIEHATSPTG